ncbi:MAG: UDP-N-acetylmuramate dehydrogenase [Acidimicrobiales bacterium]|jgi:UDP-N-acetylmuramate dehydrogenase
MVSAREAGDRYLAAAIEALVGSFGARAVRDAPLGARTTYRVGGRAAMLVEVDSFEDLRAIRRALVLAGGPVPVLILGQGSNLLVADSGFCGVVASLGRCFDWVEVRGETVRAGGATKLPVVARRSVAAGLCGLEWAVGVPGSVGGALRMNAGGHGSDTASVLDRYRTLDLTDGVEAEHGAKRLAFGYRHSALSASEVVLWAQFALGRGDTGRAQAALAEVVGWRRAHQPGGSNAGSVFVNPPSDSAGRLVEEAGLRGFRMGSARVSEKHANFIQADERGSADDVRRLLEHVRAEVARRTGVELTAEVQLVGFEDTAATLVHARA